jgi:hypothetical protein
MLGNGPVQFGKGATEKGCKVPRRCPTSFGKGITEKAREGPRRYPTSFCGGQTKKELQNHLVGWLPDCPGHHESAGKRLSGRARPGNHSLKVALVQAAHAASRTPTYLGEQYRRIMQRRGSKRAAMAVAHSILVIFYHMMSREQPYQEKGVEFFHRLDQQHLPDLLIRRLEQLGYQVIAPAASLAEHAADRCAILPGERHGKLLLSFFERFSEETSCLRECGVLTGSYMHDIVLVHLVSGCGAVGSAPGLGPGGPRFKSAHPDVTRHQQSDFISGSNSAGRVPAFQAGCRGFESRLPLSCCRSFPVMADQRPLCEQQAVREPAGNDLFSGHNPCNNVLPSFLDTACLFSAHSLPQKRMSQGVFGYTSCPKKVCHREWNYDILSCMKNTSCPVSQ